MGDRVRRTFRRVVEQWSRSLPLRDLPRVPFRPVFTDGFVDDLSRIGSLSLVGRSLILILITIVVLGGGGGGYIYSSGIR